MSSLRIILEELGSDDYLAPVEGKIDNAYDAIMALLPSYVEIRELVSASDIRCEGIVPLTKVLAARIGIE